MPNSFAFLFLFLPSILLLFLSSSNSVILANRTKISLFSFPLFYLPFLDQMLSILYGKCFTTCLLFIVPALFSKCILFSFVIWVLAIISKWLICVQLLLHLIHPLHCRQSYNSDLIWLFYLSVHKRNVQLWKHDIWEPASGVSKHLSCKKSVNILGFVDNIVFVTTIQLCTVVHKQP